MTSAARQIEIVNQRGLHARAAAKFVKTASAFEAKIDVCHGETEVCGPIMGHMLAASKGTVISVRAVGEDAEAAVEALSMLVRNRFDEGRTRANTDRQQLIFDGGVAAALRLAPRTRWKRFSEHPCI